MKPVKKECTQTVRYICEELGENLHSRKCASIRKHLAGCKDCTDYLLDLRTIVALYRAYPIPPQSRKKQA